ncbi:MAG: hypothetical protein JWR50_1221 [Mucilaginibacter sp.]|nr:hypothetical protein [Mucilaginibacter sp.]
MRHLKRHQGKEFTPLLLICFITTNTPYSLLPIDKFTIMEKFEISVLINNEHQHFEIRDYIHHDGEKCKYEIFKDGQFIGGFEPDHHKILHICKNPGIVPEDTLHLIAEQLEGYNI